MCEVFYIYCALARNRTSNNGLEVHSYIHLTTRALPKEYIILYVLLKYCIFDRDYIYCVYICLRD